MANPTVDWATKVITVPQSFLTYISGSLYELDVDEFRLALKDIEDSEEGMTFLDMHRHNTEVTLSGVTYARTLEIINGYTLMLEDGQYSVRCVGANHNLGDVKNVNQVSLIIGNSAGLIVGGSGITQQDKADIIDGVTTVTAEQLEDIETDLTFIKNIEGGRWVLVDNQMVFYKSDNATEVARFNLLDADGVPAMENVMERVRA